jgi:GTP cyclohydrolase II
MALAGAASGTAKNAMRGRKSLEHAGMKQNGFQTLLGDTPRLTVERAIAELRAGRPVLLRCSGEAPLLVAAFENLHTHTLDALKEYDSAARVVISAARMRHLGAGGDTAGALPLAPLDLDQLAVLAASPAARLDAPAAAAGAADDAALELVRLSLLLPVACVAVLPENTELQGLWSVEAEAVRNFDTTVPASLHIVSRAPVPLEGVEICEFVVFRGGSGLREQVAVIIGKPAPSAPVLLRIHSACLTGDLFGSLKCDCGDQLRDAVRHMAEAGGGVLLYLDQEGRGNGIANKIHAYGLQHQGYDTYDADGVLGFEHDHRRFDIAASMLRALGYTSVLLMTNNPQKIRALEEAGLDVAATQRIITRANGHSAGYIAAKRDKAGHLFDGDEDTCCR